MGRPRLTEAEREERRKERNRRGFANATFREYDPTDEIGYGSQRQWRATASASVGKGFTMEEPEVVTNRKTKNADLLMFNLDDRASKNDLKLARVSKIRVLFNKYGSNDLDPAYKAEFEKLQDAYKRIVTNNGW